VWVNGKQLTVTVTNSHLSDVREAEIAIRGASIASVKAVVLSAPDIHNCNTFANPRAVVPREEALKGSGSTIVHRFPPASVTKLDVGLV
jgi:alpha-L-arabinofuranosidase